MKSRHTFSILALLALLCATSARADEPVTVMNGGIRGNVVQVQNTHLVEWTNNTLHKLKFTYTLTFNNNTTVNGSSILASKQTLKDTTSAQKLHNITNIKITHIDIVD